MDTDYRVFIIDDDLDFADSIREILQEKYLIQVAQNADHALKIAKQFLPHVALLDIRLGRDNGLELMTTLKQHYPDLLCILITAYADTDTAINAIKNEAYDYLRKPLHPQELLVTLDRCFDRIYLEQQNRQAVTALQASEEHLRQIINSISDYIYVGEITAGGQYENRYLSPNIENLTGYPGEKFMTDWLSSIVDFDDKVVVANHLAYLAQGQDNETEYRLNRANGEVIWVRDNAHVIDSGESKVVYGVISDITERKHLEEQLRQSQKMEAIGKLAGGVAHDFNNLLTVIIGSSELILTELDRDDALRRDVEQIRRAADRAASLTRQLLAFSRRQVLQPRILNLNTAVTDMEKLLRRLIGEDIELVTALQPGLALVKVDPAGIEQVIMNLAVNARDAMVKGGRLTIQTANIYLNEIYARRYNEANPGPYVMLTISDTGLGMDEKIQEQIFEPFFTTKEQGKGTGLGLSTVYGIISQSGGHIEVDSKPDQGTVFKIYLPQVEPTSESVQSSQSLKQSGRGTETILVVEDNDMVRQFACKVLKLNGYTVLEATDGQQAGHLSAGYPGPIHLLLTDMVMPGGLSGPELVANLSPQRPEMKVLYISGYTDDTLVDTPVSQIDLLPKPFSPETLVQKVRQVLDATVDQVPY